MLGFNLSVEFIENELGIKPELKSKTTVYWSAKDFTYLCYQMSQYVFGVREDYMYSKCEEEK